MLLVKCGPSSLTNNKKSEYLNHLNIYIYIYNLFIIMKKQIKLGITGSRNGITKQALETL